MIGTRCFIKVASDGSLVAKRRRHTARRLQPRGRDPAQFDFSPEKGAGGSTVGGIEHWPGVSRSPTSRWDFVTGCVPCFQGLKPLAVFLRRFATIRNTLNLMVFQFILPADANPFGSVGIARQVHVPKLS